MIEKLKALLQWFVQLEREQHRHWCRMDTPGDCMHKVVCWYCTGIFCARTERKNCADCEATHGARV